MTTIYDKCQIYNKLYTELLSFIKYNRSFLSHLSQKVGISADNVICTQYGRLDVLNIRVHSVSLSRA